METLPASAKPAAPSQPPAGKDVPSASTKCGSTPGNGWWRLPPWLLIALLTPPIWKRVERFDTGPDYRIPYRLSKDYWLYQRRLQQVTAPDKVIVLGDSVVWGEYVLPDGTLSHFLNREAGTADRFVNGGLNGVCSRWRRKDWWPITARRFAIRR